MIPVDLTQFHVVCRNEADLEKMAEVIFLMGEHDGGIDFAAYQGFYDEQEKPYFHEDQKYVTFRFDGEDFEYDFPSSVKGSHFLTPEEAIQHMISGYPQMQFTYTNYKGKKSVRTVIMPKVRYAYSEYHSKSKRDKVWLMSAFDLEKGAFRDFCMNDIEGETFSCPQSE